MQNCFFLNSVMVAPVAEWLRVQILLTHLSFNHLTTVSEVGSSPIWGTCETSQVLFADVPGIFFWVFSHFWSVSYELK